MFNNNTRKGLKAWVRFDGNNNAVAGSLIFQKDKPKVGKWKEYVDVNLCCSSDTTTTTTSSTSTSTSTTAVPTTTTTTTTQCLSKILINGGPGTDILSMSVNGVPVTVTSGSFPVSASQTLEATTNQTGNVTLQFNTSNGAYGISTSACASTLFDYYSGSSVVTIPNVPISCTCFTDLWPTFNLRIGVVLD